MSAAPLLVLGAPRSGAGAIGGLFLAAAGMRAGDRPPPSPDRPLGVATAVPVTAGHELMLEALGRDWTCPPLRLDPTAVPAAPIQRHIREMSDGAPWLVTDTPLLFTLPVWLDLLPAVRLLGVARSPTAASQSLVTAAGLDEHDALRLVTGYNTRLAQLQESLGFPVIEWTHSPRDIAAQAQRIALELNLEWDAASAAGYLRPSLTRNRPRRNEPDPAHRSLTVAAQGQRHSTVLRAEAVRDALSEVDDTAAAALPRHLGPAFAERHRLLWRDVPAESVPNAIDLVPAGTPASLVHDPLGHTPTVVRYSKPAQLVAAMGRQQPDLIVAAGLTDDLGLADLQTVLGELWHAAQPTASLHMDLSSTPDDGYRPGSLLSDIFARAAGATGWRIANQTHGPHADRLVLRKSGDDGARTRIEALEEEVARLRARLGEERSAS